MMRDKYFHDPFVSLQKKVSIDNNTGCWNISSSLDKDGYPNSKIFGKTWRTARWTYYVFRGKIPNGLVIDHLCKNVSCVNPYHLEPVTQMENCHRGDSLPSKNKKKTHCKRGHLLSGNNVFCQGRMRRCKKCKYAHYRSWFMKKRGVVLPMEAFLSFFIIFLFGCSIKYISPHPMNRVYQTKELNCHQVGAKFSCDMPPDAVMDMFLIEGKGHYDAREEALSLCLENLSGPR